MRILITAGPTREYIDSVRFLSNASSGRMGYSIAEACRDAGHDAVLVSGPVRLANPPGCELHAVETTSDLEATCTQLFPTCDGVIAAAAVCDYRPAQRVEGKMKKTGGRILLELEETTDVLATLGEMKKPSQWILGFALESHSARQNAVRKLKKKNCDFIVLNHPTAIGAENNSVEVLDQEGQTSIALSGKKPEIARQLIKWVGEEFGSASREK